jgi:hypothetical protein
MTMASMEAAKEKTILFFFIFCAAVILRLYIVTLDMNILLDQGLVQDDAFYYYVIARNIIEHAHSSFDGINLTNGYHPLWQAICLPVFYYFQGDTAIRVMLVIASFFDLLALVVFYKILCRSLNNHYVVLVGVAILAFHGAIIRTWFNGLETALSIFSLSLLLHQFLLIRNSDSSVFKEHVWLGFIAAIAFLSRTDNAIIILCLFAFLYLPPLFTRKEVKCALVTSIVFITLVIPWLAWNIINFGSIVQISGQIQDNTWLLNAAPVELSIPQQIIYGILKSIAPIKIVFEKMFSPGFLPILPGYIYFFVFLLSLGYAQAKHPPLRKNIYLFAPFIVGVIILFLYHAGVRHFVRGWYNAPFLLVLILLLCFLLDTIKINALKHGHKIIFFIILTLLLTFYSPYSYTKRPKDLHLDDRVAIAGWINTNTPTTAIIGAANAGIMGYYTQRIVVNLDGVVNEGAFRARINNRLQLYIKDERIDYLADHKGSVSHLCKTNPYYNCTRVDNLGISTQVVRIDD